MSFTSFHFQRRGCLGAGITRELKQELPERDGMGRRREPGGVTATSPAPGVATLAIEPKPSIKPDIH